MSIAATSGAIAESGQERPSYSDFLGDSTAAGTDDLSAELAALKDEPLGAMNPVSPLQQSIQTDLPINPPVSPSSGTGVAIARRISNVSAGRKSEVWCNVEPSSWSGSGSSGSSAYLYGQAGKAILPILSALRTNKRGLLGRRGEGVSQWNTRDAAISNLGPVAEWKISLEGFPFGSYLVYFWDPIFGTQGATVSRVQVASFPPDISTASVRYAISSSIGLSDEPNFRQEFGATDSNSTGVSRNEPVIEVFTIWGQTGLPDGMALYRKMGHSG